MDLPPSPEDPLAQPTRAQILSFLIETRAPQSTEEVAERFGLHPNGVRRHLERLEEGGFVSRSRVRGGPGRPRDSWTISAEAHPGGKRPRAYSDLASWLARAIPANQTRLREVERAGREIGGELVGEQGEDPIAVFQQAIAALGFQPALEVKADGGFSCSLRNCPYRDAVRENQPVVCSLHRGLTAGMLAKLYPEAELVGFEPHDPDRAGCMVEVAGPRAR